ncbi:MAG: hypothetical protein QF790_04830 [Gammaproteobacteria bacterium]|jgi:hypothetical protein|nr:hypothetical protein [Gammaproteobacteria bacterium]MDP6616473.1 hypothetical protein [Gammaproteobacteria bacterium]MDP6694279.1 hypothetical protein [Gammaproteobacteria bacterium]MDP7041298.1 hypothetical protein [Gammaproteobacteria bacterium]
MPRFSQIRFEPGQKGGPGFSGNPIGRAIAFIIGLVAFVISIFLGAIFIAGIVGLMLIGGAVFALRMWWIRRKMAQHARKHGDLEAEYSVVREDDRQL